MPRYFLAQYCIFLESREVIEMYRRYLRTPNVNLPNELFPVFTTVSLYTVRHVPVHLRYFKRLGAVDNDYCRCVSAMCKVVQKETGNNI